MQYDRFGNPTHKQSINEQGEKRSWDYKYDLRGKPIYVKDPEKNVYKFQYDANGNLMSTFENDKETARYVYNGLSWKLREIDPATEKIKENYEYDRSGNLASFKDQKGNIRKYTYTPFYELDTMQVLSGKKVVETEKNTYDPTTRQLLTQQNNDTKVSYTYDSFLRPTSMTTFGRTYEQRYEDEDDTPDSIVYPDGTITAYNYDELGRILSVKHPGMGKITYDYDTSIAGNTVHVQYPNGTKIEKGFNSFGQTTDVQHFLSNNKAWEEQNQYNGFGNLVETTLNQSAFTFGYDKLDRIRKETTPTRNQTYRYDERGNRQSIVTAKSPTIADSSYTYDALNRLKTYTKNGKESTYTYYPGELRASKEIDGKTTHYVYLNGNVIEALDDKNNLQARNIWGNELLYRDDVESQKQGYFYTNAHGDIVEIKDKTGQTLNKYEYDLWGNVESKQEKMSNPFLYAGEIYDEESGLIYLRARYYDPNDGRFITEDTYKGQVDNPLSLNRYTYGNNNPLVYVDPSGHIPTVKEAADIAAHIYYNNYNKAMNDVLLGGWKLIKAHENETLRIGIYQRKLKNGTTEFVLANKGTSVGADWIQNFQQPFGFSADMENSLSFARNFVQDYLSNEITFVGHSKGGAEAAANAIATNKNAILFNPATVNLNSYGLDSSKYKGYMAAYIVEGDILNSLFVSVSKPIGTAIYLPQQYDTNTWNPKTNIENSLKNHSMDAVKQALNFWR